jgi:hypothetical protein
MIVPRVLQKGPPKEMNYVSASDTANIVENVVDVGMCKADLPRDPLGRVFVLNDERNRNVDLEIAAFKQHEQPKGRAAARAQSGNKNIRIDDNLPFHIGIIYDTILSVKSPPEMQA